MFKWLTNLFKGTTVPELINKASQEAPVVEEVVEEPKVEQPKPVAKPKKQAKKTATKKTATTDLEAMNKTQLLALAKEKGVKANASLKKAEIIERLK